METATDIQDTLIAGGAEEVLMKPLTYNPLRDMANAENVAKRHCRVVNIKIKVPNPLGTFIRRQKPEWPWQDVRPPSDAIYEP